MYVLACLLTYLCAMEKLSIGLSTVNNEETF